MKNYKIIAAAIASFAIMGCQVDDDAAAPSAASNNAVEFSLAETGVVLMDAGINSVTNSVQYSEVLPANSRLNLTLNGAADQVFLSPDGTTSSEIEIPIINGVGFLELNDVRMNYEAASGNQGRIVEGQNSVAYVTTTDLTFRLGWESNSDIDFVVSTPSDPAFFSAQGVTNPEGAVFPLSLPEDVYTVSFAPFSVTPSGTEVFNWLAVSPSSGLVTGNGTVENAQAASGFFTIIYNTIVPIAEIERTTNANGDPIFIVRDIFE